MYFFKGLRAHAINVIRRTYRNLSTELTTIFLAIRIIKCKKEMKKIDFWRQLSGPWGEKTWYILKEQKSLESTASGALSNFWPLKFGLTQISILPLKEGRNV